ncbi:MAG: hypothetical protein QNJ58_23525 [Desulfobacterales bacterium]|nr:hypothetical protein [Desulfobacterales bacterium]
MQNEEITDVKADPGNPLVLREFEMDGLCSADDLTPDRKAVIKVLKREVSSGQESVTIQLRTVPFRPDKSSQ